MQQPSAQPGSQLQAYLNVMQNKVATGTLDDHFLHEYMNFANSMAAHSPQTYTAMVNQLGQAYQRHALQGEMGPTAEAAKRHLVERLQKATGGKFDPTATEKPNPLAHLSGPNGTPNISGPTYTMPTHGGGPTHNALQQALRQRSAMPVASADSLFGRVPVPMTQGQPVGFQYPPGWNPGPAYR